MTSSMKCWSMDQLGMSNLKCETRPIPKPAAGEVLVKVSAVSLNYRDFLTVEGAIVQLPIQFPFSPGSDMCGSVVEVGEGVKRFQAGDRVISVTMVNWLDGRPLGNGRDMANDTLGGSFPGVMAEYLAMPESWLIAAPSSLSDAEAATLPTAGVTAWAAMVEQNHINPGQTILIQGTGGVALFCLQLAKIQGAETFVTTSSNEKAARLKDLGADHCINRNEVDWVDEVFRLTNNRGVDQVIDLAGGDGVMQSVSAVAGGGRVQIVGGLDTYEITASSVDMFLKAVTLQGVLCGPRRACEEFVRAVDANGLKPVIGHRFDFSELPAAFDQLCAGAFGKIVLTI